MDSFAGVLLVILVIFALYFLPTIVAEIRHHKNALAIEVLNFFLGWTFLGWVIALIWASTDNVVTKTNFSKNDVGLVECPYCREKILSGAVKCKHCGSEIKQETSEKFIEPNGVTGGWPSFVSWIKRNKNNFLIVSVLAIGLLIAVIISNLDLLKSKSQSVSMLPTAQQSKECQKVSKDDRSWYVNMDALSRAAKLSNGWYRGTETFVYFLCGGDVASADELVGNAISSSEALRVAKLLGISYVPKGE